MKKIVIEKQKKLFFCNHCETQFESDEWTLEEQGIFMKRSLDVDTCPKCKKRVAKIR